MEIIPTNNNNYSKTKNKQTIKNTKEKLETLIIKKIPSLLDDLYKKNLVHNDWFILEKENLRRSFLDMSQVKLQYVTKDHGQIEAFSSSDDEIEDGLRVNSSASMKEVCKNIIDLNTFMVIVNIFF